MLFHNQGCKKDPHRDGQEGKRSTQIGTRDIEKERDITELDILRGESGAQTTYWGPWDPTLGRQVRLAV